LVEKVTFAMQNQSHLWNEVV